MPQDEAEATLRKLCGRVIHLHKKGADKEAIAQAIETLDITPSEAEDLVEQVIDSYSRGIDLSKSPGFLESYPTLSKLVHFLGGVALVFIGSIILSLLLGLVSHIFNAIGLGEGGEVLVRLGEKAAGGFMGLVGMGACSATRSMTMLIGCIIGVMLYYSWLLWW